MEPVSSRAEREPDAEDWVRWANTPYHDAYWSYRAAFFHGVVWPRPGHHRDRQRGGPGCPRHGGPGPSGDRNRLLGQPRPPRPGRRPVRVVLRSRRSGVAVPRRRVRSGGRILAYNSLQMVPDMAGTVGEASRLLKSGGQFCVCVGHPMADVGRFLDDSRTLTTSSGGTTSSTVGSRTRWNGAGSR